MYKRDQIKEPKKIERDTFITEIMILGLMNEVSPNTIVSAVLIADRYVNDASKYYSIELVHIAMVIACKYLEDWGSYDDTNIAADEVENRVIYEMEWEICNLYNFCFPIDNILTQMIRPIINILMTNHKILGSDFYRIAEILCRKKELLSANPATILLALKIIFTAKMNG